MRTSIRKAVLFSMLALAVPARGDIQKSGQQEFPGKFLIGVDPIGLEIDFRAAYASYKLALDFAYRVIDLGSIGGLYAGGGASYAVSARQIPGPGPNPGTRDVVASDLQPWLFVMVTFEKKVPLPLVPFLAAGLGTDIFWNDGALVAGALAIRIGAGFHYYLTRNVGLGLETHFTFGPSFSNTTPVVTSGYGQWDLLLGARFAF